MLNKRILLLGGSYAQIVAIKAAKEKGLYVILFDYLPNNPGIEYADEYHNVSTTDKAVVLKLAKKLEIDYIMAYASDPAAPTAAFVSEKMGLPGNSYKSVQILSEKDLFRDFLIQNGFNAPKSVSIKQNENFVDKISCLQFPIIVKPTDSSGSKGVTKLTSFADVEDTVAFAFLHSRNKRIIAEEFIESSGEQLHGDGFVFNGELIFNYLGDHHYNNKINPFVPFSTTWPSMYKEDVMLKIDNELKNFIRLSGYKNGPVNIEVRINDKDEIYIMEIGPRSGGNFVPQIIKYATAFDMVDASLDLVSEAFIYKAPKQKKCAAYYVIHSEYDGELLELSFKKELLPFIKEFHQYNFPGDKVKSFQGANAALGVLLLLFKNNQEMNSIIEEMENKINLKIEKSVLCQ